MGWHEQIHWLYEKTRGMRYVPGSQLQDLHATFVQVGLHSWYISVNRNRRRQIIGFFHRSLEKYRGGQAVTIVLQNDLMRYKERTKCWNRTKYCWNTKFPWHIKYCNYTLSGSLQIIASISYKYRLFKSVRNFKELTELLESSNVKLCFNIFYNNSVCPDAFLPWHIYISL